MVKVVDALVQLGCPAPHLVLIMVTWVLRVLVYLRVCFPLAVQWCQSVSPLYILLLLVMVMLYPRLGLPPAPHQPNGQGQLGPLLLA